MYFIVSLTIVGSESLVLQVFEECTCFNGNIIRQNVIYSQKINVWSGILGNHIVSSILVEENLIGNFLFETTPQYDSSKNLRDLLNQIYSGLWIARHGPPEWPAR